MSFKFRECQEKANNAISELFELVHGSTKGRVIMPTGSGKTLVQAEAINKHYQLFGCEQRGKVYAVFAPRLDLIDQLVGEYADALKFDFIPVIFNSSNDSFTAPKGHLLEGEVFHATTNYNVILTIENGERLGYLPMADDHKDAGNDLPVIVFTTYDSGEKILKNIPVSLLIADEAHNIVSRGKGKEGNFAYVVTKYNDTVDFKLFFTATPRNTGSQSENAISMTNVDLFGSRLVQIHASDLFEKGELVMPRTHIVKRGIFKELEAFEIDTGDAVDEAAETLKASIMEDIMSLMSVATASDDELVNRTVAKILVSSKGSTYVKNIERAINELEHFNGWNVYSILSGDYGPRFNGKKIKVDDQLTVNFNASLETLIAEHGTEKGTKLYNTYKKTKLKLTTNRKRMFADINYTTEKCFVIHYDIISEGIDIKSFTGVVIMRGMMKDKMLQTIGRVLRIHPSDQELLENSETITIELLEQLQKPFGWVIIPVATDWDESDADHVKSVVSALRGIGAAFRDIEKTDLGCDLIIDGKFNPAVDFVFTSASGETKEAADYDNGNDEEDESNLTVDLEAFNKLFTEAHHEFEELDRILDDTNDNSSNKNNTLTLEHFMPMSNPF